MKRIFLTFAAVAAIVSCKKAEDQIQPQAPEVTITAEHLKTVIDNDGAVNWDGDEKISVIFTHRDTNGSYVAEFENGNEAGPTARFVGTMDPDVNTEAGWSEVAYCVCPSSSVDAQTGEVMHSLPAEQYAHSSVSGSFETGLNLSYASLSLDVLEDKSQETAMFQNALSVLRLTPGSGDITSITINASAPLVGEASMAFDTDGKLVLDSEGEWGGNSVVLFPSKGNECFTEGETYNILVYPGAHTSFSVTLNYKEYGNYTKTLKSAPTFKPAKYYTIGFTSDSEVIITELANDVTGLESRLPSLDELDELEENVKGLLNQIQSISLVSEYLDNAVYARYAQMTYSKQKIDLSLDYIVKPEAAAEALVEAFNQNPAVVSGLLGYGKGAGLEMTSTPLAVKGLTINNLPGIGKVVTATVDATAIDNKFYEGDWDASVALQISSGKTDIISDFANLVPKAGSVISGYDLIPAVPGARVVIPFSYAVSGDASYTLAVTASQGVAGTSMNYYDNSKTGNLTVSFAEGAIQSPSVTLTLTVGEGESQEVISHDFTFVDSGSTISFVDPGQVDYIGGEITLGVNTQNIQSYSLSCSGEGVSQSGSIFTFSQNNGNQRTVSVECQATIPGVSFNYYKSITITQRAYGTDLSKTYYSDGHKVVLNQANASDCSKYFNVVILGDGYQKKDLAAGGKFERSARSAMDSFFAIEPYKSFQDRFNVYMVAYESVDEGTDIKSSSITKDTYFNSYCQGGGNTAAYADTASVVRAVKSAVGSDHPTYYRSIAILLINTDEQAGSTGYPFRDYKSGWPNGYASFAISVLAANSTGTNGLVKHEAGGHAFGRLADEYYTSGAITSAKVTELNDWHAKGWYWNVTTDKQYWNNFTNKGYKSDEVDYVEGAWNFATGIYRPTSGGMMQNNNGVFNAPSRHAIYHRIITESLDVNPYSWSNFLEYDQKNR